MKREFEYLADQDIVLLKTSGPYKFDTEIETVIKAVAKLKEHNCIRLLVDHRQADVSSDFLDIHGRPKVYNGLEVDRLISAAYVFAELNDDIRFYEDVCRNRGWNVRVFDDYKTAVDWLLKQYRSP